MDDMITAALPTQALVEEEKSSAQKETEYEQKQEDHSLAALHLHPGWKQIADRMRGDIIRIRSLADVEMKQYTDKELGEVVRSDFQLADKLEAYLNTVEEAVKAVVTNGE